MSHDAVPPPAPLPASAPQPDPTRRHTWVIAGGFVLGAVLLYGFLLAASGGDVPRGTTVLGVDIGGMSQAEATAALDEGLAEPASQPIEVSVDDEATPVPPEQLGLSFDASATAAAATARSFNPITLLVRLVSSQEVDPVVAVDEAALDSYLDEVGADIDVEATNGDIRFTETSAVVVAPVDGRALDRDAARTALVAAYLSDVTEVELPLTVAEPEVGAAAVQEAFRSFGQPAMARPVVLVVDRAGSRPPLRVTLRPADFGPTLRMRPTPVGTLEPAVRTKRLGAVVDATLKGVLREPKDASFKVVSGRPVVVPARAGQSVDPQALSAAMLKALPQTNGRTAKVTLVKVAPELTTAAAKDLGVTEEISRFTQYFPYAAYRVTNIGQAAEYIDGTVLMPGETFSMNDTARERTVENGYTVGYIISDGRFAEELGGGVSTITTAMWHAAFFAGMERVEQRAHSFYISRYLPGLEATVAWGSLDLKFRNDGPTAVLIKSSITNSSVTVAMYGTKRYDIDAVFGPRTDPRAYSTVYDSSADCVPQPGVGGFRIVVTRVFKDLDGTVVKREKLPTTYRAATNVRCGSEPKPPTKPTPKPSPKPEPKPSKSP